MDPSRTQPRAFTLPERTHITRSLVAHGLAGIRLPGITTTGQVCHGYAHGCGCGCKARPDKAPEQPRQPWEVRPLRKAA